MKVLIPLNGHLLIKPRPVEQSVSGIAIPDSVDRSAPTIGEVVLPGGTRDVKYGEKEVEWKHQFRPGMIILFSTLHPRKVMHDGEECLLIPSEDVYAVIEE